MISDIFKIFLIGSLAFIPILIWGYIFSYIDNSALNSRRFISGIIAGGFSVVPVLYSEQIYNFFSASFLNIFNLIGINGNFFYVIVSLLFLTFLIAIILFLTSLIFFKGSFDIFKIYGKNIVGISIFILIFAILNKIIPNIGFLDLNISSPVSIGKNVFNTLGLIILYYIIIGLVEEISKHFSFLPSSITEIDSVQKGVLLATFIALGFGFIENILYLYNISIDRGVVSGDFATTLIFRSIFSLFVHIFCGVIVGLYFSRAYLFLGKNTYFYIKTFLFGLIFSITLHAIFDISLTLGFTPIIFIYAIYGYLYITKTFYKEEN
ncbi:PrsW family intramembrane metalloprotease [Candidatus Gracilibacteria bacterium]|nr:PrsW family intramembrane metalloprotease [Candidatus Gracilibacteria bacterium]